MEINLQGIKFSRAYDLFTYIMLVFSPLIVFLLLYDYTIIEKLDSIKIIIVSIALGGFLFIIDVVICSFYIFIIDSLSGEETKPQPDDFDIDSNFAILIFTISNVSTIFNLIQIKFYTNEKHDFWIKDSIDTWLLTQFILVFILCIIGIIAYQLNKKEWRIKRAKRNTMPKNIV